MAFAMMFESSEVDQAAYDALMEAIGRASLNAPTPEGFIAHLAGPMTDGGWRVVDLWDSEEAANAFYSSEQFRAVAGGPTVTAMKTTPWPLRRVEVDHVVKELAVAEP